MLADADVAVPAALIGDPTRAAFLQALVDATALPAGELARRARVSPSTASQHLAQLVDGGLLAVEPHGRHRYFRLADETVAHALEALSLLAPPRPARSLREADAGTALREARTCYDHLAGRLGVAVTEALRLRELDRAYELTAESERRLAALGVAASGSRRAFARPCLDWTERRHHLAGALGAALCARLFELGWVERIGSGRAVGLKPAGRRGLASALGVDL